MRQLVQTRRTPVGNRVFGFRNVPGSNSAPRAASRSRGSGSGSPLLGRTLSGSGGLL